MRIVVALGGNALLRRGEPLTLKNQRINAKMAVGALAPIAEKHKLIITHGNGPQVGLLALQAAAYSTETPPLDILGAQTKGMIGYMIEQELGNLLPHRSFASLLTMVEVDGNDPAFKNPSKFIGPVYDAATANVLASEKGWVVKQDGDKWRRVVPSPKPRHIFQIKPIKLLVEHNTILICAGGGGIPTMFEKDQLVGVDAVIDKDLTSSLLARELEVDLFIMATDVDGVYENWGKPDARHLDRIRASEVDHSQFAEGSMGPKVKAACEFVLSTGKPAVIASLSDIHAALKGEKGTLFEPDPS